MDDQIIKITLVDMFMHFIMEEGLLKRGQYDLIYVECVLSQKKNNAFRDRQTGETDNFFRQIVTKLPP